MSTARQTLPEEALDRSAVLPTYARADLTIVRGKGCRVWDDAGRAYLDFGGGIAVTGLGHRHPVVTAAAHAQLDALWHASNLYWTEPMLRLATLLSERALGRGYLRPEAVRSLVSEHVSRRADRAKQLWALLALELWHRAFIDADR